ncbi:MAG: GGDEF domain-containing protein [Actinomycetota bacterium]
MDRNDPPRRQTARQSAATSDESILNSVSGLPDKRFFVISLDRKVALARRTLKPLALGVFQIDDFDDFAPYLRDHAIRVLSRVVQNTMRDSDTICHVDAAVIAAVLDDTSETGAVWAADRIRRSLLDTPAKDIVTMSAGLACYPSHAMDAEALLDEAYRALNAARALGPGRIEVASVAE